MKTLFFILIGLFSYFALAQTLCSANNGNTALVIIDMQPYFASRTGTVDEPENQKKLDNIINEQLKAIANAKRAQIPIVFLEYEQVNSPTNPVLVKAVANYKNAHFFRKTTDGMFDDGNAHKKELQDFLKSQNVGTLIITGANGDACVKESIAGALADDCNVIAYSKGIADFNFKDFIYPYEGHYSTMPKNCQDCSFKETSSLETASRAMVNYSGHHVRSSDADTHGSH